MAVSTGLTWGWTRLIGGVTRNIIAIGDGYAFNFAAGGGDCGRVERSPRARRELCRRFDLPGASGPAAHGGASGYPDRTSGERAGRRPSRSRSGGPLFAPHRTDPVLRIDAG